jgi:hypothetical protein
MMTRKNKQPKFRQSRKHRHAPDVLGLKSSPMPHNITEQDRSDIKDKDSDVALSGMR